MFEALKPWLDREQFDYIRKHKEEKEKAEQETSQEAKELFKAHMKELGVSLPEGVEVSVQNEQVAEVDEESSEVVE